MKKLYLLLLLSAVFFTKQLSSQSHYATTAGNGNGFRMWHNNNTYSMTMGNTSHYKYGWVTDYSIKFSMNDNANRGWSWGIVNQAPVASMTTRGHFRTKGILASSRADIYSSIAGNSHIGYTGSGWNNGWTYLSGKGIIFRDLHNGSYVERMMINDAGNVSIGLSNTAARSNANKLHVSGIAKFGTHGTSIYSGNIEQLKITNGAASFKGKLDITGGDVRVPNSNLVVGSWSNPGSEKLYVNGTTKTKGLEVENGNYSTKIEYGGGWNKLVLKNDNNPNSGVTNTTISTENRNGNVHIGVLEDGAGAIWQDMAGNNWDNFDIMLHSGSTDFSKNVKFHSIAYMKKGLKVKSPVSNSPSIEAEYGIDVKPAGNVSIPDYVFEEEYDLKGIDEVAEYIKNHKHLPGVIGKDELEKRGKLELLSFSYSLLEKIEELVLYTIDQEEQLKTLSYELESNEEQFEERLSQIEATLRDIKK